MKITRIQAFAHGAPTPDLRGDPRNYCYVRVDTDSGLHGWGEATCGSLAVVPMVEELGRALVGRDPFAIQHLWQRMFNCHHNVRGGIIHMAALSGIDVALWDIKGKALGVPVYELLGGAVRDDLWCYGRFDGGDSGEAVAHARREVDRGFTALKADPFSSLGPHLAAADIEAAAGLVWAVREAVGPSVELLVEAHGRLNVASALRFLDAIAGVHAFFVEEPLPPEDIDGLARLALTNRVPIAAGERLLTAPAFLPLLQRRLVDVVQPDPAHAGGISGVMKIAALAEAHHVAVQPHNPYGPINTMASAHLSAALPNFLIMELIMEEGMHDWFDRIATEPFPVVRDGRFPLPSGPGLGVDVVASTLSSLPPTPERHPSSYLRRARSRSRQGIDWA